MHSVSLLPVFLVGLAGSVHCVGMCGGIVGALSTSGQGVPVQVRGLPQRHSTVTAQAAAPMPAVLRVGAYNAGRLLSYSAAGALAGGVTGGALILLPQLQHGLLWAANLMLVALGLFLLDAWRVLTWIEAAGSSLWRRISPLLRRVSSRPGRAGYGRLFALGALWGWIPCGMVYSALSTAMLSGSATGGAQVMLAFGLGTLPMLVLLGTAGQGARRFLQQVVVRRLCGLLILAFGIAGLVRASRGALPGWLDMLCISAGAR